MRAARLATEGALAEVGTGAGAVFVFCAGAGDLAGAEAVVREVARTRSVVAVAGHAVAAGDREIEGRSACAVLAIAGVEAAPFATTGEDGAIDAIEPEVEALLGRSTREADLVVVFADPLGVDPRALAASLRSLAPATVVGAGVEAAPTARLASGGRSAVGGACGLVLALPAPARVAVSQGSRPVTDAFVVTRASGHWVQELAGKPALDVYREVVGEPLADDLRRAAESVLLALPRHGATWVARRIAGFDADKRAFAAPEAVSVGSALRFALRDADYAREDLARALAAMGPSAFGLHLCASDRGRALFGHAGLEASIVARALAPAPTVGLVGSFEIGPLGGHVEALAHASVVVAVADTSR